MDVVFLVGARQPHRGDARRAGAGALVPAPGADRAGGARRPPWVGHVGHPPADWTLDDEVADLAAVLDAVGCDRAVLLAYGGGGPPVIGVRRGAPRAHARARALRGDGRQPPRRGRHVGVLRRASARRSSRRFRPRLGHRRACSTSWRPSAADDERMRTWLGRLERQSMSPSAAARASARSTRPST